MSNYQFLNTYFHLLEQIDFCQLTDNGFALMEYTEGNTEIFWNCALINKELSKDDLSLIEKYYKEVKRESTIYFENTINLSHFKKRLSQQGYSQGFEDSWMFYQGDHPIDVDTDQIIKVSNEDQLNTFSATYLQSYQKDDPQNPYGAQDDYIKVLEQVWLKCHDNGVECFIAYDKDLPVAVATLTSFNGLGYISNIGTIRSARSKGFGKLITLHCVKASMKNSNTIHCLATEEGTYPYEFYRRIGFEPKFNAVGYSKKLT